jgi:hypothetical protein
MLQVLNACSYAHTKPKWSVDIVAVMLLLLLLLLLW